MVLIGAGYLLGDNWATVGEYVGVIQYAVIALVLADLAAGHGHGSSPRNIGTNTTPKPPPPK